MTANTKRTIKVGKAEIVHSAWSNTVTFTDTEGNKRVIDDSVGHVMLLIEATSEEYREHGSFMIPEPILQSWSHPVISDGKMYLREQDNLFCYDIAGETP